MRKQGPKHLMLAFFALAITVLVGGVYAYMQHAVNASVGKAALARDIVRVEEANKVREQEIRELHERTVADRARLIGAFVPVEDIVGFIETVEKIGEQAGARVALSGIDTSEKKEGGGEMRAQVEVTGSWSAVMKTLILAEDLPYGISIKKVSLSAVETSNMNATTTDSRARNWKLMFSLSVLLANNK